MNIRRSVSVVLVVVIAVASSQVFAQRGQGRRGMKQFDGPVNDQLVALDEKLRENVLLMREEEKLARDVYLTLGEKHKSKVFSNIAEAESRHMAAMKRVITNHELKDPIVDDKRGKFTNPELTKLYKELVESGSQSLVDAYRVGALIEELDISDLIAGKKLIAGQQDVEWVYQNLTRASRNHLRAFASRLKEAGHSYEAKHLSQKEFDQIASSPIERGHGRRGRGRR